MRKSDQNSECLGYCEVHGNKYFETPVAIIKYFFITFLVFKTCIQFEQLLWKQGSSRVIFPLNLIWEQTKHWVGQWPSFSPSSPLFLWANSPGPHPAMGLQPISIPEARQEPKSSRTSPDCKAPSVRRLLHERAKLQFPSSVNLPGWSWQALLPGPCPTLISQELGADLAPAPSGIVLEANP